VTIHHRRELDAIQRELREESGVTALIYDQTCAAEKRRRRKKGEMADPPKRAFINTRVCEGCGDCNVKSNCLSVIPVETELGRKRAIDQGQCNKDFSCVDGFCPSFVTVHGGRLHRPRPLADDAGFGELPQPRLPALADTPYGILITGVGGTGIVTVGALLGMAAHLEGKGVAVLDMTGLAQKYGAVTSHVRIAPRPEDLNGPRIPAGEADVLLGADLVVAAGHDSLAKLATERSAAVVNAHGVMTASFIRNPDQPFPGAEMLAQIRDAVAPDRMHALDMTAMAERLFGNAMSANVFLLGFAWQRGYLPLSAEAIEQAIRLNGTAVDANLQAFLWGRRAAHDPEAVEGLVNGEAGESAGDFSLQSFIRRRVEDLTAYQNAAYARRYTDMLDRVKAAEQAVNPESSALQEAVARSWFRLLAYKDEYEVARLYTDGLVSEIQAVRLFEPAA
jgi:indolepyruvate ferredoxin oxidoreductase